jgi:hypothetical protein
MIENLDPKQSWALLQENAALVILEKSVERGIIVQDTGFTVFSKNFSFRL